MKHHRAGLAIAGWLLLAAWALAQEDGALPFPLREMLPRILEASGGMRAWRFIRDVSIHEKRRLFDPDGSLRAVEDVEVHVQRWRRRGVLMVRPGKTVTVHQGWQADESASPPFPLDGLGANRGEGEPWMVEDGLLVRDRRRLEEVRRELLETRLLHLLPFSLLDAVTDELVYEGEFLASDRHVHRLRFKSGEFPGGAVWILADAGTTRLRALGYFEPGGAYREITFGRWMLERGIELPWIREHRVDGRLVRRDEVQRLESNRWLSQSVFQARNWLRR